MPPARPPATPKQVADYLNKSEKTLANWRYLGIGPDYIKAEGGIRYRWEAVEKWLSLRTVRPGRTA